MIKGSITFCVGNDSRTSIFRRLCSVSDTELVTRQTCAGLTVTVKSGWGILPGAFCKLSPNWGTTFGNFST